MAKILFIDDDDATLLLLGEFAACSGNKIDQASSVKDALALVKDNKYCLIFLDFRMPEYDGNDFLQIYESMFPERDTPIVVISVDDSQETFKKVMASGARGFLSKPVNKLEMLRLIEVYCS